MKKHVKYKKVYLAPYSNNDLKLKLKESIDWLSKKLESPLRGRIPFYIKEIEKYEKYRGYINDDMYKILMSYYEIFSINIIAENFKNNTSCEFIETLKKVTKGIDVRDGDKVLKDESRNFIFELLMASYFAEKIFLIDLSTKTDFIVKDLNILVECKRVTSEKKILERINDGVKQITKRKVKDENLGIVFIDISELIDIPKRIVVQVPLENSLTLLTQKRVRR